MPACKIFLRDISLYFLLLNVICDDTKLHISGGWPETPLVERLTSRWHYGATPSTSTFIIFYIFSRISAGQDITYVFKGIWIQRHFNCPKMNRYQYLIKPIAGPRTSRNNNSIFHCADLTYPLAPLDSSSYQNSPAFLLGPLTWSPHFSLSIICGTWYVNLLTSGFLLDVRSLWHLLQYRFILYIDNIA